MNDLKRHTIKPGTWEHGTTEQRNTGGTFGIPRNSGTTEQQSNTEKYHLLGTTTY